MPSIPSFEKWADPTALLTTPLPASAPRALRKDLRARLAEELLDLQRLLELVELLHLRQGRDEVVHLAPGQRRVRRADI